MKLFKLFNKSLNNFIIKRIMIDCRKRCYAIITIILSVVSIFGCGGKGFSLLFVSTSLPDQQLILDGKLTWQDSLVQEMVDIINPDTRYSKSDRNRIERKIKSFPHKRPKLRDAIV